MYSTFSVLTILSTVGLVILFRGISASVSIIYILSFHFINTELLLPLKVISQQTLANYNLKEVHRYILLRIVIFLH